MRQELKKVVIPVNYDTMLLSVAQLAAQNKAAAFATLEQLTIVIRTTCNR